MEGIAPGGEGPAVSGAEDGSTQVGVGESRTTAGGPTTGSGGGGGSVPDGGGERAGGGEEVQLESSPEHKEGGRGGRAHIGEERDMGERGEGQGHAKQETRGEP